MVYVLPNSTSFALQSQRYDGCEVHQTLAALCPALYEIGSTLYQVPSSTLHSCHSNIRCACRCYAPWAAQRVVMSGLLSPHALAPTDTCCQKVAPYFFTGACHYSSQWLVACGSKPIPAPCKETRPLRNKGMWLLYRFGVRFSKQYGICIITRAPDSVLLLRGALLYHPRNLSFV